MEFNDDERKNIFDDLDSLAADVMESPKKKV